MDAATASREWFASASAGVVELVGQIPPEAWAGQGLGVWSVRELVAHTMRGWTTVTLYLAEPEPRPDAGTVDAVEYLVRGMAVPGVHEGVAQRGRDEALSLGEDPPPVVREAAAAAAHAILGQPDGRRLPTRFGVMTLGEFLRTRAFELTVHGIDIVRATGAPTSSALRGCLVPALAYVAEVAGARGSAVDLLAAATGRGSLPEGFSVLA